MERKMIQDCNEIARLAALRRADALALIHHAGAGHIGGAMSSLDILSVLYYGVLRIDPVNAKDPARDRFLLSKGHSVEGLYALLADLGFMEKTELATFCAAGSRLLGHPSVKVPGVEMNTGALGHGLPVGVGLALGAKRTGQPYRTYVLMGDGEQAEGSVWEAAMAGARYGLDNLTAIIDRNGLQISGTTEEVMALEGLAAKWRAFGWAVTELNGHDHAALLQYFTQVPEPGKPRLLVARTVKGKGLPFAEGKKEWHHKVPTDEQAAQGFAAFEVKEVDWL